MNKNVLITGGSGLIGGHLSELLTKKGYNISHLSRTVEGNEAYKTYSWDVEEGKIDTEAFKNVSYIIHLAGAAIAEKKWTENRKKKILESRTKSSDLIYKTLSEINHCVKAVISASGIGIYGADTGDAIIYETFQYGNDFLAEVSKKWEAGVKQIEKLKIRVVRLRIGLVLAKEGGALPKLVEPIKWGIGAPLGAGDQYYSWIHICDLSRIFLEAIENERMRGPYNAVAPNPVTNKKFTEIIASKINRPLILPNVPTFIMKLILGERSDMVLGGNKVSCSKLKNEGFKFIYNDLGEAIEDLLLDKVIKHEKEAVIKKENLKRSKL